MRVPTFVSTRGVSNPGPVLLSDQNPVDEALVRFGEQTKAVGQAGISVAQKLDEKKKVRNVLERLNGFYDEERNFLGTQYALEGKNAVIGDDGDSVTTRGEKWYGEASQRHAAGLDEDESLLFNRYITSARNHGLDKLSLHQAQQGKVYDNEVLDTSIAASSRNVMLNYNDMDAVGQEITRIRGSIQAMNPGHNTGALNAKAESILLSSGLSQALAKEDFGTAKMYLDRFGDKLSPAESAQALRAMQSGVAEKMLQGTFEDAMAQAKGDPEAASKLVMNTKNYPDLGFKDRLWLGKLFESEAAQKRARAKEALADAQRGQLNALLGFSLGLSKPDPKQGFQVDKDGNFLFTPDNMKRFNALDVEDMLKVQNIVQARADNIIKHTEAERKARSEIADRELLVSDYLGGVTAQELRDKSQYLSNERLGFWTGKLKDKKGEGQGVNFFEQSRAMFAQLYGIDMQKPNEEEQTAMHSFDQNFVTLLSAKGIGKNDPAVLDEFNALFDKDKLPSQRSWLFFSKPDLGNSPTSAGQFVDMMRQIRDNKGRPQPPTPEAGELGDAVRSFGLEAVNKAVAVLKNENARRSREGQPALAVNSESLKVFFEKNPQYLGK